ncbi:MAG TPA: response regulator [Dongiaceae bacterium]|nr:response regulator [Dongiaceae bacterium]
MEPEVVPGLPVRILHLEDDAVDAELIQAALAQENLDVCCTRVSTREEFIQALDDETFQLVISDYSLPSFDGDTALRIVRGRYPDLPFIIVSGRLGEEAAVESVRAGATDYVLKQRLSRLGPSVRRALAEAEERVRRRNAETALQQSEAQLRQAQKMEAIGILAGGIAHDFNNLLTAIMGYSQLLQKKLEAKPELSRNVDEILKAGERAASLTRQLLAFSRQQVLQPRILDLNIIIADMGKMLRRIIGADVRVETVLGSDLPRVKADPGQIEQVLLNLAVNARDAMPQGGSIKIETHGIDVQWPHSVTSGVVPPGAYVVLAVGDTGCGIDPHDLPRVFEPFFTTKEQGKGTGLGLSTVHGIVQQSGGYIDVSSQLRDGTTFKVYLPAVQGAVETHKGRGEFLPAGGSETLLVIEDEDQVRKLITEVLRQAGYNVLEAANRNEAAAVCQAFHDSGGTIDLMLTDVVMPGMSAIELMERLKDLGHPGRVLYMSGYADKAIMNQVDLKGGKAFLQKPIGMVELLRRVREVLEDGLEDVA